MPTYTTTPWSLDDLFNSRDSQEMKQALDTLDTSAKKIELHRGMLSPEINASDFLMIIKELEELNKLAYRVYAFASLSFAADTQDQGAQTFLAQIQQIMAGIENRILFFSLWWKELEKDTAQRLLDASGDYRYWLEQMRLFKPHTLTEAEEKIINIKNTTGASALQNLYDSITNRYVFHLEVDGEEKQLTRGEIMVYARGYNPDLRRAAYQELYRIYGEEGPILGQIYQTLVRDWKNEQVDLRSFTSPIAARNLNNDIPDPVVETLLEVSKQNAPLYQRFFRLKAHMLQMDKLRRYDIYAPIAKADKTYSFDTAAAMVLTSFNRFDPKLEVLAKRVFDTRHLDSEVRPGKRSGAFCSTVTPDLTPWVLVNYQGKAEDVATLAHELGHAIHSMLAEHHSLFTQHSSLPLAETASTFGEMMLVDQLLEQENDETVRRDLLFRQVDDSYATIMRQSYFALFERQAHEMIQHGASVDDLANTYIENLVDQFGDSLEIGDEFRWEWVSIPHIYQMPFYVYAYAFGQLLVLSLYRQFKSEGEAFKPRYLEILSAGGSKAPVEILSKAGIDVNQAEFWQGGFDEVARLIDRLESMVVIND
jgi:oligoendopeptidase F